MISSMTKKERADPTLLLTDISKRTRLERLAKVSFAEMNAFYDEL